jgi:catechol 2,3-dioxygenase-like lactoylglutathione lyase family enzyme
MVVRFTVFSKFSSAFNSRRPETRSSQAMRILGIDHVQLAMPPGQEGRARAFYVDILGLIEVAKPPDLARRAGAWFELGPAKVHLGVEHDFRPARKAHPGLLVEDLPELVTRLELAGYLVAPDNSLEGYNRAYVDDPFGNRIELIERIKE